MRDKRPQLVGGNTRSLKGLLGNLRHLPHRPAEHRRPILAQRGPNLLALTHGVLRKITVTNIQQRVSHPHGSPPGPIRAPHGRGDPRLIRNTDNRRARTVTQQERNGALGIINKIGQLLHTNHQHILRRARTHQCVRLRDPVAETGARRRNIVGGAF